ncbi:hypothetical protein ZOSMA_86G00640 [Zostera marina]|uniref:Uncharacterized protein n=1 Tax=Zostera marina TaxID=29655 RepID=A0A0K9NLD9_ZOSMR|nr:hypothetical protein ZOSMA_86G00640 [Zostera marina]
MSADKNEFKKENTAAELQILNLWEGPWSQDELQQFFDLVNLDYRMSFAEIKDSEHGMVRPRWERTNGTS